MAIGSYAAYKLRENRQPQILPVPADTESAYFERITAEELSASEST